MNQRIIKVDTAETTSLIFGAYDVNLRIIEDQFPVSLRNRSGEDGTDAIIVSGESMDAVNQAAAVVEYLRDMVRHTNEVSEQSVRYVTDMIGSGNAGELASLGADCIFVTAKGKPVKAKTAGQSRYVEAIRKNTVTLGVGPAGTGKTFLAVAMAVKALKEKQISRIIPLTLTSSFFFGAGFSLEKISVQVWRMARVKRVKPQTINASFSLPCASK